jgi:hypothetical protein
MYFIDTLLSEAPLDQLRANSYLVAALKQLHKIKNPRSKNLDAINMHIGKFIIAVITNEQPCEIMLALDSVSFKHMGSNLLIKFLALIYKNVTKNMKNRLAAEADIFAIEKSEWYFEKVITHLQNVSFHVRDKILMDAIKPHSIVSFFSAQLTIEKKIKQSNGQEKHQHSSGEASNGTNVYSHP